MKLFLRGLRKLSWRYGFAFMLLRFAVGATPVFVAFFATNGVSASTVVIVVVTSLVMVPSAGGIVAIGEFLKRRLLSRFDEQR